MRKNDSIAKSLLRLFLLFISFIGMMVFIFLFRPEYFIDDIELIIKNKLSNSVDGELHIESINGNFIKGFKVKEIYYSKDSTILFSAKEIYMDPDLSRIALGTIAFSEVIVVSMFINFQSSLLTRIQHKKKTNISFFNTVIESLIIDNGLIFAMDHLYKLNGKIVLDYSKVLEIDIYSLDINSPAFQDVMVLDSGNLIYNNEEIKLSNAIIKSDWVAGTANIIVNIRDFQKSSANIQIDKFISEIINDLPINIKELSINIDSRHGILIGELQCDVEILNIKYSDIFISGIFSNNLIELNNASLIVDGQHIMSSGIINILEKSWEIKAIINEYKLTNSTLISGEINISSDFNLENYNGSILLNNSLIDSVDISSISGQYKYSNGILSSDKITVESVGQISNIIINSFSNIDN